MHDLPTSKYRKGGGTSILPGHTIHDIGTARQKVSWPNLSGRLGVFTLCLPRDLPGKHNRLSKLWQGTDKNTSMPNASSLTAAWVTQA